MSVMKRRGVAAIGLAAITLLVVLVFGVVKWNEQEALDDGIVAVKNGDYGKAVQLLTPLSDAGNPVARDTMGIMYAYGWGVERNRSRAAELMRNAKVADLGDRFYSIGKKLENSDHTEAIEWYRLAAEEGHAQAKARIAKPSS